LLSLEDPAAEPLLEPLSEEERFGSWHLVGPDGRIASRGAAGVELLEALGYPRSSRTAARAAGPIERLYGLVARHRDKLGHLVRDGSAPRRYP
jgi:hypothetical protein